MRGLTEEAAAVTIEVATRVLHLPTVRTSADELAAAAVRDRITHRAYLAELLSAEVDDREGGLPALRTRCPCHRCTPRRAAPQRRP